MARKKRTSSAEDVMLLVARLPWWAGVLLAVISYFVLHAMSVHFLQPRSVANPKNLVVVVLPTLVGTLSGLGQYIIPLLCCGAAAVSAVKQRQRRSLLDSATTNDSADALADITWYEFEQLVGEGYRRQRYTVTETGGVGQVDGGVDLILKKGRETFLVQCKQWRAFRVGVDVVRELYGVMAARGAAGGFVVTSGKFTAEAIAFAGGRNISLVDGAKLHGLLRSAEEITPVGDRGSPNSIRLRVGLQIDEDLTG